MRGKLSLPKKASWICPALSTGLLSVLTSPAIGQTTIQYQARLITCNQLTMNSSNVPQGFYVIASITAGSTISVNSPNDPVSQIRISPPQTLDPTAAFSCPTDYSAWTISTNGRLRFNRAGFYWARVVLQSGAKLEGYIAVDQSTLGCGDGSCTTEIDCGSPDVPLVSDGVTGDDPWGGSGTSVDGHASAGQAVCDAYDANGGNPVSVNITAHGGPGGFKVGNDETHSSGNGGGASELAGEFKDANGNTKVSDLTVFSCSSASGASGEALFCELEQELGCNVTGYTGTVSYGGGKWYTAGDAYSWEEESATPDSGNSVQKGLSIPITWLTDTPVHEMLNEIIKEWGQSRSAWDVNLDGTVNTFDLSILLPLRTGHKD